MTPSIILTSGGPGIGFVVAIISLIGAILLWYVRR